MKKFEKLTTWTFVLSFLIIVGAGHGVACIGLLEFFGAANRFEMGTEYFSFSLASSYDKSLPAAALFFFIGHFLLLLSLFFRGEKVTLWTKLPGLAFTWLGFLYLTHNVAEDTLSQIGFFTGTPYLICSFILAYKVINEIYTPDSPEI